MFVEQLLLDTKVLSNIVYISNYAFARILNLSLELSLETGTTAYTGFSSNRIQELDSKLKEMQCL